MSTPLPITRLKKEEKRVSKLRKKVRREKAVMHKVFDSKNRESNYYKLKQEQKDNAFCYVDQLFNPFDHTTCVIPGPELTPSTPGHFINKNGLSLLVCSGTPTVRVQAIIFAPRMKYNFITLASAVNINSVTWGTWNDNAYFSQVNTNFFLARTVGMGTYNHNIGKFRDRGGQFATALAPLQFGAALPSDAYDQLIADNNSSTRYDAGKMDTIKSSWIPATPSISAAVSSIHTSGRTWRDPENTDMNDLYLVNYIQDIDTGSDDLMYEFVMNMELIPFANTQALFDLRVVAGSGSDESIALMEAAQNAPGENFLKKAASEGIGKIKTFAKNTFSELVSSVGKDLKQVIKTATVGVGPMLSSVGWKKHVIKRMMGVDKKYHSTGIGCRRYIDYIESYSYETLMYEMTDFFSTSKHGPSNSYGISLLGTTDLKVRHLRSNEEKKNDDGLIDLRKLILDIQDNQTRLIKDVNNLIRDDVSDYIKPDLVEENK